MYASAAASLHRAWSATDRIDPAPARSGDAGSESTEEITTSEPAALERHRRDRRRAPGEHSPGSRLGGRQGLQSVDNPPRVGQRQPPVPRQRKEREEGAIGVIAQAEEARQTDRGVPRLVCIAVAVLGRDEV